MLFVEDARQKSDVLVCFLLFLLLSDHSTEIFCQSTSGNLNETFLSNIRAVFQLYVTRTSGSQLAILLSYGRPCLTYHRGTLLASTGCAHGLRSSWNSTKRSLQRFVLHIRPVSGLLSPFLRSLGSVKRSVDAAHSKTTKRFGKMAWTACLSSVGCGNLVRFCRCFSTQTVHEQRATTCQRGKLLT